MEDFPSRVVSGPMATELLKLQERVLAASGNQTPLRVHGARTKDFYGESLMGEPLNVAGYRGIVDYEPSELVISARCGTPLSEIERALAERGQFLAFEPPRFRGDPTVGGVIATGLSGPRRIQTGAARDFVLGAKLLGADGELLRFGGQVMKNVAGFDVARLLCGSLGVFGIITEVSIKVLPLPRAEATLRREMTAPEAVEAFNRWAGQPLPISGAAWHAGIAWIRLSGAGPAVQAACASIGGDRVPFANATQWWNSLRDGTHPLLSASSVWRVSVPSTAPPLQLPTEPLIDWGGALRWYAGDLNGLDVRRLAAAAGGTALRWRGSGTDSRFHPLQPGVAEIHRRLKRAFDPNGLFNPGRLLAGM
jgi:glycolate oxidase FAD binding subunit